MIVACGPESNGTKLLSRILATSGEEVVHRSLPYGKKWWKYNEFPEGTRFVAIFRNTHYAVESVLIAGHIEEPWVRDKRDRAHEEQIAARVELLSIPGVIVVSYEALIRNPDQQLKYLEHSLDVALRLPEPIRNENAKYGVLNG